MKVDRRVQRLLRRRDARDVIDVGVGEQDVLDVELAASTAASSSSTSSPGSISTASRVRSHPTTKPFL